MRAHTLVSLWLALTTISLALLEEAIVSFTPQGGAIPIHNAAIIYDANDPVAIDIATKSLAEDLKQITGQLPTRHAVGSGNASTVGISETAIIAATANSTFIKTLERRGLFNVSDIRGEWETFRTGVVKNYQPGKDALVIAGSDKRGVVYGIHTLAEQCGQSPYHWWADVPATKHDKIYALPITTTHGEPSVKYRGIFINDEAPGLTGWWSKKHGVDYYPLDSEFYAHVFDLILRLKGNFMWPAMWRMYVPRPGNIFFTDDPYNQQLADDYGVVVSTSHHEPMQRATNEWNSSETGPWDWTTNKDNIAQFMEEGVSRAGNNESYFTLGLRGASDSELSGDDPVAILNDVIATQRDILREYHGDGTAVSQVWTLYKEVVTYYAAGVIPPEDVTLMFTDDNWGNVMRLPTAEEAARAGGIGLYYHFEYVGRPKSYKWQNTNNLGKVYKELHQALERGADRIWVFNVADIKPMEVPLAFAMDLAWDSSKFTFEKIPTYLEAFASREFGSDYAEEIGSILLEQSRLIGRRKYESTTPQTYSFYNYNELETVLSEWEDLGSRVATMRDNLSPDYHPAFLHLVQYPIQAGLLYHRIVLGQYINQQYAIQRRNTANDIAYGILDDSEADADLLEEYNAILDGKWDGILSQPKLEQWDSESWYAPSRDLIRSLSFVQPRQDFVYVFGNLGIAAEGSQSAVRQSWVCETCDRSAPTEGNRRGRLPVMDPYSPHRTVQLFHRGDHRVPIQWRLEIPYDWIKISSTAGTLAQDYQQEQLEVWIEWANVPADFNEDVLIGVHYDTLPHFDNFVLPVRNLPSPPKDFHGFPATTGYISIEAPHYQHISDGEVHFNAMPHLGTRSNSGALALRPYTAARTSPSTARSATAEYNIYLFNSTTSLTATLYLTQNLDTNPDLLMEYALSLDSNQGNFTRLLEEPETAGDLPDTWTDEVEDAVWTRSVKLGNVSAGEHTLVWRATSPEVYLEKIVLDTGSVVKDSYLGPPETKML
ncbi:uncharacterized protein BDV14DRAFT_191351 [Aspergillus stella-maris]|uniref:uncharacterized protein n=1 Tax=Aspergillus stella-maris TaxID=1810926 RepID=UPI003CCC9437